MVQYSLVKYQLLSCKYLIDIGHNKWKKNQQMKQNQWPEDKGETVVQKLNGKRFSKQGVINNLNYYLR